MHGDYNGSKSYARETSYNYETHNLNYYKTMTNVIDEDEDRDLKGTVWHTIVFQSFSISGGGGGGFSF